MNTMVDGEPAEPYETNIDVDSKDVVPSILDVVASVENVSPVDLPPLYETIDPDGIERVLTSAEDSVSITFRYQGYIVEVSNNGDISVQDEMAHP